MGENFPLKAKYKKESHRTFVLVAASSMDRTVILLVDILSKRIKMEDEGYIGACSSTKKEKIFHFHGFSGLLKI